MLNLLYINELIPALAVAASLGSGIPGVRADVAAGTANSVSVSDTLSTAPPQTAQAEEPGDTTTAKSPAAAETPSFPEARGSNLEGREFTLPADFDGDLNLVFIAFQRGQQALVDTWLPFAKDIAARHARLRYYELPTIYEANSVVRWFINNGMRRGISDVTAREATITLYLDKEAFRRALQIPHEDTIYILLVDAEDRVVWRADGTYTGDHGMAIEQIVAEKLSAEYNGRK
jgi:hypothetical protein